MDAAHERGGKQHIVWSCWSRSHMCADIWLVCECSSEDRVRGALYFRFVLETGWTQTVLVHKPPPALRRILLAWSLYLPFEVKRCPSTCLNWNLTPQHPLIEPKPSLTPSPTSPLRTLCLNIPRPWSLIPNALHLAQSRRVAKEMGPQLRGNCMYVCMYAGIF